MTSLKTLTLAATLTLLSASIGAACERMERVVAVWLPIMQTTAYYVALEEGLFEKACVEIVSNKLEAPNQIIDAQISYQLTDMYGSILVAGGMGYGANLLFLMIEKLFVHWSGR